MTQPEVLVVTPLMDTVMRELADTYPLHLLYEAEDRAAFLQNAAAVRGIATDGAVGADAALMSALPNLEIVSNYGVGVDAIDLQHAAAHNIMVANTPGVLNDEVAKHLAETEQFFIGGEVAKNELPYIGVVK